MHGANPITAFTVRRFRPEDAQGVCHCARRIYGATYPRREMSDPDRLAELNQSGALISVVAVQDNQQVVGHLALEPALLGSVGEMVMGLVVPELWRHGLFRQLRNCVVEEGIRLGLAATFVEMATGNTAVQSLANHSLVHPCGITLNLWPDSLGGAAGPTGLSGPRRRSFVLQVRYLRQPARVVVHLPAHHRDIAARTYAHFGLFMECGPGEPLPGGGQAIVSLCPATQSVFFRVRQAGTDALARMAQAHRDFRADHQFQSMYLEFPLAQPGTAEMCLQAERLGCFFSGIGPYYCDDGDALRLQCLKSDPQCSLLQVLHPFAQELLAYVGREWERVALGLGG